MPVTTVVPKKQRFRRSLFGYRRKAVDEYLSDVAARLERVWGERAELTERVELLETDLSRHVELEGLLRATLVSAERAAQDHRFRARKEADLIIDEAHAQVRSVTLTARAEKERLESETRRILSLLRSALSVVESAAEAAIDEPTGEPALNPATGDEAAPDVRRIAGDVA